MNRFRNHRPQRRPNRFRRSIAPNRGSRQGILPSRPSSTPYRRKQFRTNVQQHDMRRLKAQPMQKRGRPTMPKTDISKKELDTHSDFPGGDIILYTAPACAEIATQRIPSRRPRGGGDPYGHGVLAS